MNPLSIRMLQLAIDDFVHRPPDEHIKPDQLRDLIEELETELELLYEPDPAAARAQWDDEARKWLSTLRRPAGLS